MLALQARFGIEISHSIASTCLGAGSCKHYSLHASLDSRTPVVRRKVN
jgi:hypothetical protein